MPKLIVALDCEIDRLKDIVKKVYKKTNFFKIGPILFVKYGVELIKFLKDYNSSIFLDLKLHDIPNTVEKTIKTINEMGVYSVSLHISGGFKMLEAAVSSKGKLKLWGVSILTSIDMLEYAKLGYRYSLNHQVLHFARIAKKVGLDGIISSPNELYYLKKNIDDLSFITPSIRLGEIDNDDQKRFVTPKKAVELGSDYLIVGRPITSSKDPLGVVERIIEEMR